MSQLERICENLKITCNAEYSSDPIPDTFTPGSTAWEVTLRFGTRKLTVPFYTGPAICKEPNAADVLYCLISDARAGDSTFEDFCSEFGYDSDSRKAYATWQQCQRIAPKLHKFLGDHFEEIANAEH